jgi:hypothetical protein
MDGLVRSKFVGCELLSTLTAKDEKKRNKDMHKSDKSVGAENEFFEAKSTERMHESAESPAINMLL